MAGLATTPAHNSATLQMRYAAKISTLKRARRWSSALGAPLGLEERNEKGTFRSYHYPARLARSKTARIMQGYKSAATDSGKVRRIINHITLNVRLTIIVVEFTNSVCRGFHEATLGFNIHRPKCGAHGGRHEEEHGQGWNQLQKESHRAKSRAQIVSHLVDLGIRVQRT